MRSVEADPPAATVAAPGRAPSAHRARRLRSEPWLTLAACAGAALPIVVSTIRGMAAGYVPNGDRGVIAIRAYDVFTANSPLVGQFSASSLVTGRTTHSPGPLLYWLLALPARLGGPADLALTMGIVDAACVVGAVLLARRRGGRAFMFVTALAIALMCRSLFAETYHDIWNPSVAVIPLTLLIFLCWSVACGDIRLLPVAVLVASFAAQAELTFLLPSAGLMLVALVGLLAARRAGSRPQWRWWLAALVVAAICWSAPVVDQLTSRQGNLGLIAQAATAKRSTVGAAAGWHAVVRAIGVPPWWLRIPTQPFDRLGDVIASPGAGSVASAVVLLAILAAATLGGILRRRRDVASAAGAGLVLCAALAAVAAATPTRQILMSSLGYTMWWGSPAGMWVWLAAGWSLTALPRPALGFPRRHVALAASGAAVAASLAVGGAVAAAERPDQDKVEYRPLRAAISLVERGLPRGLRTLRISGSPSWTSFDFQAGIAYALRARGMRPLATWAPKRTGGRYDIKHGYQGAIYVWDGRPPRRHDPRDRLLGRVPVSGHTLLITFSADHRP